MVSRNEDKGSRGEVILVTSNAAAASKARCAGENLPDKKVDLLMNESRQRLENGARNPASDRSAGTSVVLGRILDTLRLERLERLERGS